MRREFSDAPIELKLNYKSNCHFLFLYFLCASTLKWVASLVLSMQFGTL